MKSYRNILIILVFLLLFFGGVDIALAQFSQDYVPLQTIPGIDEEQTLASYLKALFNIGIAIAGILSVIMIMYGGVKYMTTEAFSGKSDAKEIITNALIGLLLAFASWIILNTINPNLLNIDIDTSLDTSLPSENPWQPGHTNLLTAVQEEFGNDFGLSGVAEQILISPTDGDLTPENAARLEAICAEQGLSHLFTCFERTFDGGHCDNRIYRNGGVICNQ